MDICIYILRLIFQPVVFFYTINFLVMKKVKILVLFGFFFLLSQIGSACKWDYYLCTSYGGWGVVCVNVGANSNAVCTCGSDPYWCPDYAEE